MREQQFVSAKNESPRMFKNNLLDYFSRAHPLMVPIVFLPVVAGLHSKHSVHMA